MKKLISCLVLLFFFAGAFSQRVYFIYLQSENEQAFFVKMNDKVFSSAASGFLILSRLQDSSYTFTIGFPQKKWPEQKFTVAIKGKDRGFIVKNLGDRGWGLYDLQTSALQMAIADAGDLPVEPELKEVSAFTNVLSKAANDPSLREKPVLVNQAVQPASIEPAVVRTEVIAEPLSGANATDPVIKTEESPGAVASIIPAEDYKPSVVTRKSESSTSEGFGLTFVDEYSNGVADTIRIMIPNPVAAFNINKEQEQPAEEKKFLDITTDKKETDVKPPVAEAAVKSPVANYCADVATDSDLRKLRKKMSAQASDDEMISEAVKQFRTKCFTVGQIKDISGLFSVDSGKYRFFDAAYAHVSDVANFPGLLSELSDKYYINRFQAMLRN